jgi:hypothetical protein
MQERKIQEEKKRKQQKGKILRDEAERRKRGETDCKTSRLLAARSQDVAT